MLVIVNIKMLELILEFSINREYIKKVDRHKIIFHSRQKCDKL